MPDQGNLLGRYEHSRYWKRKKGDDEGEKLAGISVASTFDLVQSEAYNGYIKRLPSENRLPLKYASIGKVPWSTHFCQIYQTREDLIDMRAGH
jgi:hypothetical protein